MILISNIIECNKLGKLWNGSMCVYPLGIDNEPDNFVFEDKNNVLLSTIYTSNSVALNGFTGKIEVKLLNLSTDAQLIVNGINQGTVYSAKVGDTLSIKMTSSSQYFTSKVILINVGTKMVSWNLTTKSDCTLGYMPIPDRPGECGEVYVVVAGHQIVGTCGSNLDIWRCNSHQIPADMELFTNCYYSVRDAGNCILGYNCPNDGPGNYPADCSDKVWDISNPGPRCVPLGQSTSISCLS